MTTTQRQAKRLSQHLLALIGELKCKEGRVRERGVGNLVDVTVAPSIFRPRREEQ